MPGFLLDTHVILWTFGEPRRLSVKAKEIVATEARVFVSSASLWEIETKRQIGKLTIEGSMRSALADHGFRELAITWEHAERLGALPMIHRDPFDRILVAQALVEDLTLVTADRDVTRYPVRTVF